MSGPSMAVPSLLLLLLGMCVSSQQFEQRGVSLVNATPSSLELTWDANLYHDNTMYKVWYWPVNASSSEVSVLTVDNANHVELTNLMPGHMYTIWLFGMKEGNITSDYVTFQHQTGLLPLNSFSFLNPLSFKLSCF